MAARGPQNGDEVNSHQLLLSMFFDTRSCSIRKVCNGEEKKVEKMVKIVVHLCQKHKDKRILCPGLFILQFIKHSKFESAQQVIDTPLKSDMMH